MAEMFANEPTYLPTEDEIRQRCEEIQAKWDDAERYRRSRHFADAGSHLAKAADYKRPPWTAPVVSERDLNLPATVESLAS